MQEKSQRIVGLPMTGKWLFLAMVLSVFIFGACEKKPPNMPANVEIIEVDEILVMPALIVEDELPLRETPEPVAEIVSMHDEQLVIEPPTEIEMVFVEGGSMVIQGQEISVDSFYMNKYVLSYDIYAPTYNWAIEEGYFPNTRYPITVNQGWPENVLISWTLAIYMCNYFSIKEGLSPVYLHENRTDPILYWGEVISYYYSPTEGMDYHPFYIDWDADGYRLPTEAEWEYAARGGNKSQGYIYSGSNVLDEVLSPLRYSYDRDYIPGQRTPNELGMHDMTSPASEWCIGPWTEPGEMTPLHNPGRIELFDFVEPFYLIKKGGVLAYDDPLAYKPEARVRTHPNVDRVGGGHDMRVASLRLVRSKMN